MTNTYTWVIEAMDCAPQLYGHTDVVVAVHWRKNATDGTYNATTHGIVGVTYTPHSPFTPYADLTQQKVIGWIEEAIGIEKFSQIIARLDQQIADQVNPPVVTLPLPWVA